MRVRSFVFETLTLVIGCVEGVRAQSVDRG